MFKVGLTGNIGSGKTWIAGIFERLGIGVFNADLEAKKLFGHEDVIREIVTLCGRQILTDKFEIDRRKLAQLAFSNHEILATLNQIIHPRVRGMFSGFAASRPHSAYVIYESALIFETGYYRRLDATIVVSAQQEIRKKRVMQRDKADEHFFLERNAHQMPESEKVKLGNFLICNDGHQLVLPQIVTVNDQILRLIVKYQKNGRNDTTGNR